MNAHRRAKGRTGASSRLVALLGASVLAVLALVWLEHADDGTAWAEAGTVPLAGITSFRDSLVASDADVTSDGSGTTAWETTLSGPELQDPAAQAQKASSKKKGKPQAMVGGKPKLKALSPSKGLGGAARSRSGGGRKAPGLGLEGSPGFKAPTDDGQSFQFKTRSDTPFSLAVVTPDGLPLPLARVSVVAALAPPPPGTAIEELTSPDGWFDGFSDDLGRVQATLSLPSAVSTVDVVVSVAGRTGEYSHQKLRALWGPFAPSSRITVSVDQLTDLAIELALE